MSVMHLLYTLMPDYKSNVQEVLGDLRKKLEGIKKETVSKIVRTVAADLVSSNLTRIHNEGKAVDGNPIGTYSKDYKKLRQKKGKETDHVNLTFSGKLSKEFNQDAVSETEIGIGFTTDYASEISGFLEGKDKFNKKIWGVTEEDEKIAEEIANDEIQKDLA